VKHQNTSDDQEIDEDDTTLCEWVTNQDINWGWQMIPLVKGA
jgi:hypothetical protein